MASQSPPTNNNPTGIHQYKECPKSDDEHVERLIREYHRRGVQNRTEVSQLLWSEHNIKMSETTVARRRKQYGLQGSGATTKTLALADKRQMVLDQMALDPTSRRGPGSIREGILMTTGLSLTRSFVRSEMHLQDPEGFSIREPGSRKIKRVALVSLGPHHEWSGDGHDKLAAIGFPIWGVRDVWSGKWLGLWVVPNNRRQKAVALLFLRLVNKYGGMPIQMSTDCGSETTQVFGLANALREIFHPELSTEELPAHRFLRSVRNITIERGWLAFRLQWGDNVKQFWFAGANVYVESNPDHYNLVQWLWPPLIQKELDKLRDRFNNHVVRKDANKKNPSGVAPNVAMALPAKYGGENCLQVVDTSIIPGLIEAIREEEDVLAFCTPEYSVQAQAVFESLGIEEITFLNVWSIFSAMLPLM
ncbi:hypothetical protein C0992_005461 [Termitomyces sp. T32_za158]|nr:hypothetical protein C0992_005461 [Termitomyces sp. T32_za158]